MSRSDVEAGPGSAPGRRPPSGLGLLAALGGLEAAAVVGMARVPSAAGTPAPSLVLWGVAWAAMAAAWGLARRRPPCSTARRRRRRALIWGIAVAARLALLPEVPHFSDDVFRYLWDGWVGLHGVNPYLHPPDATALAPLRTAWHDLVNHPSVSTIYPPGAQAVFRLLAGLAPSVLLFKAAWVAADLGIGWVLERLDRRRSRGSCAALLWLWSPLVIVEVAWSGHLEPLGILPMAAALLWLGGEQGSAGGETDPDGEPRPGAAAPAARGAGAARDLRAGVGGALLGLGAAIKFAPAAALPALARRHGRSAAAAAALVPALLLLPYLDAGAALFAGLGEYATRWEFGPGLFAVLEWAVGGDAARLAAVGVPTALALAAAWRRWSVGRALFWCLGAALVLSPTLHPWYLLWVLPFVALRGSAAWILWTGTIFLGYAGLDVFRATGAWPRPALLGAIVHLPFLALLAAEATGRLPGALRRRSDGRCPPEEASEDRRADGRPRRRRPGRRGPPRAP